MVPAEASIEAGSSVVGSDSRRRMAGTAMSNAPGGPFDEILEQSCEHMSELSDESVSLTVTSPPYWNAIDYDKYAQDKTQHFRTRSYSEGFEGYADYLEWLERVFGEEVLRVTKPGGFCAVVIGTVLHQKRHLPAPFELVVMLVKKGWEFHQDIIWHKCTAGIKRAGSSIQMPFPGYYYPNIMTEFIMVFRKPGEPIYRGRAPEEKERARYPINRLFTMDTANNVWHIAPVPPDLIDHPCPYPEEIPERLVSMYSYPGELVLDPFAGSGQTLKVASRLGRKYVGYETQHNYAQLAKRRIHEPSALRAQQLVAVFEKVDLDQPLEPNEGRRTRTRHGSGRQKNHASPDRSIEEFDLSRV